MGNLPVATHKVRVIHLDDSPEVDGYNEGLFVGQELLAYDLSNAGSIAVVVVIADGWRESALFKGEYEIIEEYTQLVTE